MRNFQNLLAIRRQCYRYPRSLGTDEIDGIKILDGLFICDSSQIKDVRLRLKALRSAAWLNQDALCLCKNKLKAVELHHALITKRDVQGTPDEIKLLIHHSYNVILAHPECHKYLTRKKCFDFLSGLYGNEVQKWYQEFPLKTKLSLGRW